MKVLVFLVSLSVFLAIQGCSKVAKQTAEKAIESEISRDGGAADVEIGDGGYSMEIKGEDGKALFKVGSGGKIPDDFPNDVPVYKGMTVNMAHAQQQQGMFMIQAVSSEPLSEIASFYEQETTKAGWKEESSTKQGDKMRMLSCSKGDRQLNVILAVTEDGTNVTLNTSQK